MCVAHTVTEMRNGHRVCEICGASVKRERYSVHVKKHLREEGKVRSPVIVSGVLGWRFPANTAAYKVPLGMEDLKSAIISQSTDITAVIVTCQCCGSHVYLK